MRILVVGGSTVGLLTAVLLARNDHEVTVLETDPFDGPADPVAAWERWDRPVPQLRFPHGYTPLAHRIMSMWFPDLLATLVEHGAQQPAVFGEPSSRKLLCRRTTVEWAARRLGALEGAVQVRHGTRVVGVLTDGARRGATTVTGVVDDRGGHHTADLVLDVTGCGSQAVKWLGRARLDVTSTAVGNCYFSRWFRLDDPTEPLPGANVDIDLGFGFCSMTPADSGFFCVTFILPAADRSLRELRRPAAFAAAVAALPDIARWVRPDRARPAGPVRYFRGCQQRSCRITEAEQPSVLGWLPLGDAALCTNPMYGWGTALGLRQAELLGEALAECGADVAATAVAYQRRVHREVAPWYELSRRLDRFHWGTGSTTGPAFRETSLDPGASPRLARAMQLIEVPDGITTLPTKRRTSAPTRNGWMQQLISGVAT